MSQVGRVVNVMLYVQSSFTARISITIQSRELAQMRFTWKSIFRRLVIVGFGTSSGCIILHRLFVNSWWFIATSHQWWQATGSLVTSTLQQGRRVHRNLRTFFGRVGVVMPTVMNVTYLHFLRHDRRWLSQSLMAEEKTVPPGCPGFYCIQSSGWAARYL